MLLLLLLLQQQHIRSSNKGRGRDRSMLPAWIAAVRMVGVTTCHRPPLPQAQRQQQQQGHQQVQADPTTTSSSSSSMRRSRPPSPAGPRPQGQLRPLLPLLLLQPPLLLPLLLPGEGQQLKQLYRGCVTFWSGRALLLSVHWSRYLPSWQNSTQTAAAAAVLLLLLQPNPLTDHHHHHHQQQQQQHLGRLKLSWRE
jgi:hypothetical protein